MGRHKKIEVVDLNMEAASEEAEETAEAEEMSASGSDLNRYYLSGELPPEIGEDHWRDIHWVYNHLRVEGLVPKDAPTPGAWFWLQECRASLKAAAKFRTYYMKLAPTRKELDERASLSDGGESVLALIDAVERVLSK